MTAALTPVAEVVAAVERAVHPTPPAEIVLDRCWRSVLAEDVNALVSLPPHDNSAMDGYAVRSEDTVRATAEQPVTLRVVGHSHAGVPPAVPCAPGDAVEIATGAMLPAGADAVVRVEEAARDGDGIRVREPVAAGRDVRWEGEDIRVGDLVLRAGQVLGMTQLAAVAAAGHRSLRVHRPARVAIVLTGDEVSRDGDLDPGKVPDALGAALAAAIQADNAVSAVAGPIGDDEGRLAATLTAVAGTNDLVVTAGGISVGPRDRLPTVLGELGTIERWKVAVKPGKPFALSQVDGTPVLSLPGNPVAALAAYELFVRPALGQLAGRPYRPRRLDAALTHEAPGSRGRLHLLRGEVGGTGEELTVTPLRGHGAGSIASVGAADAWIVVPAGVESLPAGERVGIRMMAGR